MMPKLRLIAACAALWGSCALAAAPLPIDNLPGVSSLGGLRADGAPLLEVGRRQITLDPIRLEDLADGPSLSEGTVRASVAMTPGGLSASMSPPEKPLFATVRRQIPGLWRMTRGSGNHTAGMQNVRVTLESPQGEPGQLRADDASVAVKAYVTGQTPRSRNLSNGAEQLEGDVVLEIPSSAFSAAGRFRGRLVITMEGY